MKTWVSQSLAPKCNSTRSPSAGSARKVRRYQTRLSAPTVSLTPERADSTGYGTRIWSSYSPFPRLPLI